MPFLTFVRVSFAVKANKREDINRIVDLIMDQMEVGAEIIVENVVDTRNSEDHDGLTDEEFAEYPTGEFSIELGEVANSEPEEVQ